MAKNIGPDVFCYFCGDFTKVSKIKKIVDFVDNLYHAYLGTKLGDRDKSWFPHIVCKTCPEHLC